MKTWFVTNIQPNSNGSYDRGLETKLQQLEDDGHVIFTVTAVSGQTLIVSYKE